MAIALTPFQALCGFRPVDQITNFFKGEKHLCDLKHTEILSWIQIKKKKVKKVIKVIL